MVLSIGKWTPPPRLKTLILSVCVWRNILNPIMALICLESWPEDLSAGLHAVVINPCTCWFSCNLCIDCSSLHFAAQHSTVNWVFLFLLFRNDTKEDVFVHQVSCRYYYILVLFFFLNNEYKISHLNYSWFLDSYQKEQPEKIPSQCWRWRNCGVWRSRRREGKPGLVSFSICR